ncbi:MAG: hypothetical protein EBY49_10910, partial [Actinobacteria bacterium]|nr:hypothetical protein [Actinomycetota bacterium]
MGSSPTGGTHHLHLGTSCSRVEGSPGSASWPDLGKRLGRPTIRAVQPRQLIIMLVTLIVIVGAALFVV